MNFIAQALTIDLGKQITPEDIEAYAFEGDFIGFIVAGEFIWMTLAQWQQYLDDVAENYA